MSYYTLHGFVAFVFFCPIRSFSTCAITKIIAHFSMGVNVLTLNMYMIMAVTISHSAANSKHYIKMHLTMKSISINNCETRISILSISSFSFV